MHYQDGTPVQIGDLARKTTSLEYAKTSNQQEFIGTVAGGTPGSTACNLQLLILATRDVGPLGVSAWRPCSYDYSQCMTASECLLIARAGIETAAAA